MGVTLFVGGHAGTIRGERETITGKRMFTAAYPPQAAAFSRMADVVGYLDSGAFSDSPAHRLSFEDALTRQLKWEKKASGKWASRSQEPCEWKSSALVSYDLLIDEVWLAGEKHKRRWTIQQAEMAVKETVGAARFLASRRNELAPRRLILSAQGVDAMQYRECVQAILKVATLDDIIGFGGWCILGRFTSWLPEFWRTLYATLPLIAQKGIKDIHIFGVLYLPALGGMLWLADRLGLRLSTDSSAPVKSAACKSAESRRKAGCRADGYLANVTWWQTALASLRQTEWYKQPPQHELVRQLALWE